MSAPTSRELAERFQALFGGAIRPLKRAAARHPWNGQTAPPTNQRVLWSLPEEPRRLFSILLTFDQGYHASGWWRNSQYDRCWHLSMTIVKAGVRLVEAAFETPELHEVQAVARAFFGDDVQFGWVEPPASVFDSYRNSQSSRHCYHVRIFVNQTGEAIQPQGEVYNLVPFADGTSPEKVFR